MSLDILERKLSDFQETVSLSGVFHPVAATSSFLLFGWLSVDGCTASCGIGVPFQLIQTSSIEVIVHYLA